MYFYPRTLSALPHDCLPTLEPGTRSRISARFMAPGHETPLAHQEGAPRAGGGAVRALLATCAPSSGASKVLRKPEAFPIRGLAPPGAERVREVVSVARSGPGEVVFFIWFGRTRVYIRQSVCTE